MFIDIPDTPVDEPVFDINIDLIAEIVKRARRTTDESTGTGLKLKIYQNALFSVARDLLHLKLSTKSPASWILESYKQLQMWTFVFRSDMKNSPKFHAPKELAPAGRYGWRYAIDHLLPDVKSNNNNLGRPNTKDVTDCFTTLLVMATSSEWSNLIHYFPDVYGKAIIDFSNPLQAVIPRLHKDTQAELEKRQSYMKKIDWRTWEKYPDINVGFEDKNIKNILNNGFSQGMGFSLDDLKAAVDVLSQQILNSGFIIVHSLDYFVEWIVDYSRLDRDKVNRIFDFMLISATNGPDIPRDFLDKVEPLRIANFAGVRLPAISHLDAIYAPGAVTGDHIRKAKSHIIISLPMLAEWQDILQHRLSTGQRTDLKEMVLKSALEEVEQYQRRTIFEGGVSRIFQRHGFICIVGLKKWPTATSTFNAIPCGEIDIIAYHDDANLLVVAECKAGAAATDARGYSQQYRDHFQQKKYHKKFLSKIEWLQQQVFSTLSIFEGSMRVKSQPKLLPLFITKYPSIAKYYVNEYRILTFEELDSDLDRIISMTMS